MKTAGSTDQTINGGSNGINGKEKLEAGEKNEMKKKYTSPYQIPQDRGYGWFVVLGCFITNVLMVGFLLRTIGILFLAVTEFFAVPTTSSVWIPGTLTGVAMVGSAVSGILADKFGPRRVVFVGAIIGSSGFVISSFVSRVEILYLTLGVMPGLAFALSYVPTVSHVARYFSVRRSLATGLGMSGSGIGAFAAAPLTTYLLEEYSLRGALLILGAFILNLACAGMLLRPIEFYQKPVRKPSKITGRDNKAFLPDIVEINPGAIDANNIDRNSSNAKGRDAPKERHIILQIICHRAFAIYAFVMFMVTVGYYNTATIVLPSISKERGFSSSEIAIVMSVFGGVDAVGRVLFSALDDKKIIPTTLLFGGCMLIAGAMCFLVNFVGKTFIDMAIVAGVFGGFVGCMPPLQAMIVVQLFGIEKLTPAFGILFMLGLPQVFIQQGAAQLYEYTGSWSATVNICASSFIVGALGLFALELFLKYKERKTKAEGEVVVKVEPDFEMTRL